MEVITMDEEGIQRCWTSDHYMPWWDSGASGGAAWPWLGAALARTRNIVLGTGVTAPILRYHPAIVAQVFATLEYMFPNRVFLGIGRGEALNEVTSGHAWPSNAEKFERVKDAILYTKPSNHIPLYLAGIGKQSARLAGEEADGFVTNELDVGVIKDKLFPALKKGTVVSGRDYSSLEKILFLPASYNEDKQKALESIRFWRGAMVKAFFDVDVHDPRKIQENGQIIGDDTLEKMFLVISTAEEGIEKLKKYIELGFTEIVLTNSSPNRNELVKLISEKISPYYR